MDLIKNKKRQGSGAELENPVKRLRNAATTNLTSEDDILDSARFGVYLKGAGEKDVICHGEGLSLNGVKRDVSEQFISDTLSAGEGLLEVYSADNEGTRTKLNCNLQGNGKNICNFTPNSDRLKTFVHFDGKSAYGSPYNVRVQPNVDPQKVVLSGLVSQLIKNGIPITFNINTKEAGTADLSVSVEDPGGTKKILDVMEDGEGNHKVSFNPSIIGLHKILVKFGGENVPYTPFSIIVFLGDSEKIKVTGGNDRAVEVGYQHSIFGNRFGVSRGQLKSDVRGIVDVNQTFDLRHHFIDIPHREFGLACNYKEPIMYIVTIKFNDIPISNGHFFQMASPSGDANKLSTFNQESAFGPGLVTGVVGQPCLFKVKCKDEGPQPAPKIAKAVDVDGAHIVSYLPVVPGEYVVLVTKGGRHFSGSPFLAKIISKDEEVHPVATPPSTSGGLVLSTTTRNRTSASLVPSTRNLTSNPPFSPPMTSSSAGPVSSLLGPSTKSIHTTASLVPSTQNLTSNPPFSPPRTSSSAGLVSSLLAWWRTKKPTSPTSRLPFSLPTVLSTTSGGPVSTTGQASQSVDAAKVFVTGLNLNGCLAKKTYSFTVDTSQAGIQTEGRSMLTFGMNGPENCGCHIICISYDTYVSNITFSVQKPGVYFLSILWGGRDIDGSPFTMTFV